jgi:hypothetical protein
MGRRQWSQEKTRTAPRKFGESPPARLLHAGGRETRVHPKHRRPLGGTPRTPNVYGDPWSRTASWGRRLRRRFGAYAPTRTSDE